MTPLEGALITGAVALVAYLVGYLQATHAMPKIIAKMSDDEIRSLGRRSRNYRLIRAVKATNTAVPQGMPRLEPEPEESELAEARRAALNFVDRTAAGGAP